jgi:hypothetical protein
MKVKILNFRKFCTIYFIFFSGMLILFCDGLYAKNITVLKSTGSAAIISSGEADGIELGDLLNVKQFVDGSWQVVTQALVTNTQYKMAKIEIARDAPRVFIAVGDVVEKVTTSNSTNSTNSTSNSDPIFDTSFWETDDGSDNSIYSVKEESYTEPSSSSTRSNQNIKRNNNYNRNENVDKNKWVYLGPTLGTFIPLGKMNDSFSAGFGYGGIFGVHFRSDLDVSMRFYYSAKRKDWSFWNLQLLGRKYLHNNLIVDFGYGFFYPERMAGTGKGRGMICLGFAGGFGVSFPVAFTVDMEFGILFHYYPTIGTRDGKFITIQGRLVL